MNWQNRPGQDVPHPGDLSELCPHQLPGLFISNGDYAIYYGSKELFGRHWPNMLSFRKWWHFAISIFAGLTPNWHFQKKKWTKIRLFLAQLSRPPYYSIIRNHKMEIKFQIETQLRRRFSSSGVLTAASCSKNSYFVGAKKYKNNFQVNSRKR